MVSSIVLLPAKYSSIVPVVAGTLSNEMIDDLLRSQSMRTIRLSGLDCATKLAREQAKVDFPSLGRADVIKTIFGGLSSDPSVIAVKANLSASA